MTSWVTQRSIDPGAMADYVTRVHFVRLEDANGLGSAREVLYCACNNGAVLAVDVTALAAMAAPTADLRTPLSAAASGVVRRLYSHIKPGPSGKAAAALPDEAAGVGVLALKVHETLMCTGGEDGCCILTSTDTHAAALDRPHSDNAAVPSVDLLAVMRHRGALRAIEMWEGCRKWAHREEERSAVYIATGCEDGCVRLYRVDVAMAAAVPAVPMGAEFTNAAARGRAVDCLRVCSTVYPSRSLAERLESGGAPAPVSLRFDPTHELLLVGTMSQLLAVRAGAEADAPVPGPVTAKSREQWLNTPVWCASAWRWDAAAGVPLRSAKPKVRRAATDGIQVGTVVDSDSMACSTLSVMLPSLEQQAVQLPCELVFPVDTPIGALVPGGGPFFSIAVLADGLIATSGSGAASCGEVVILRVTYNSESSDVYAGLVFRFQAGTDLVKDISVYGASSMDGTRAWRLACGCYDGRVSEWVVAEDAVTREVVGFRTAEVLVTSSGSPRSDSVYVVHPLLLAGAAISRDAVSAPSVATLFVFEEAQVLLAVSLFERVVQTFARFELAGYCEPPPGMVFDGIRTVLASTAGTSAAGVPSQLEENLS